MVTEWEMKVSTGKLKDMNNCRVSGLVIKPYSGWTGSQIMIEARRASW